MIEDQKSLAVQARNTRMNITVGIVAAMLAINGLVMYYVGSELETAARDISRIVTVGSAMAMSAVVVTRQGFSGLFGRTYMALAAGLVLWFMAESIWGYYEIVLHKENPFPSIADMFWLAGYGPFACYLFGLYKFYGKGTTAVKVAIVSVAAAAFGGLYVQNIVAVSDLSDLGAIAPMMISIAYPILDALLIVPAVLVVMNAGKGILTAVPWIFVSWIFTVVADSLLGFTAVQNFGGDLFIINMFYNAAYLCMFAGLLWHNKFFIFNKGEAMQHYIWR